jgi:hypothetical protein
MSDLVYRDQAIFDAIAAAIFTTAVGPIIIDPKQFIKTFNNHRDRALCTSLNVAPDTSGADGVAAYERGFKDGATYTENMKRLSASEVACYHWPDDTAEHKALRAAFMDGAAKK